MKRQWLKCRVLKGMFSDERAIVYSMSNGKESSAFVPSAKVRGKIDHDGAVSVEVFQDGDTTWAVLPTEYRDAVPVNRTQLVS